MRAHQSRPRPLVFMTGVGWKQLCLGAFDTGMAPIRQTEDQMRRILLSAAAVLAIASAPALAQSDDEMCPSGQINMAPVGSPQECETDVTATTPAPEVVKDAAEVVEDAGEAVKDAGQAVKNTVTNAVKSLTN